MNIHNSLPKLYLSSVDTKLCFQREDCLGDVDLDSVLCHACVTRIWNKFSIWSDTDLE